MPGVRTVLAVAAAGLVAATLLATSVAAADPPPGVVFDGVVNVTVREASAGGAEPGAPIADAEVTLLVTLNDFPEGELQSLTATTADDGIATFAGVARPEGDKPTVRLAAHAHQETTSRDNGCIVSSSWDGTATGTATEGPDELIVEASPASSIACPPRAVIRGRVHDPAGHAIAIRTASLSIDLPPVGNPRIQRLSLDARGRYSVTLPAWDGADGPAIVRIAVTGAVTRHQSLANGCRRDYAPVGTRTVRVDLEVDGPRPDVDVVTHEAVAAEACAAVGTPRPATGGATGGGHPSTTLPPTDTAADDLAPRPGSATRTAAIVVLLLAAIAGLAAGTRRRGPRDRGRAALP